LEVVQVVVVVAMVVAVALETSGIISCGKPTTLEKGGGGGGGEGEGGVGGDKNDRWSALAKTFD